MNAELKLEQAISAMEITAQKLELDDEHPLICYSYLDRQGRDKSVPVEYENTKVRAIILEVWNSIEDEIMEVSEFDPVEKDFQISIKDSIEGEILTGTIVFKLNLI